MKNSIFLLFICVVMLVVSCTQSNIIELPLNEKQGFGPFGGSFSSTRSYSKNEKNRWFKTQLKVTGIPDGWKNGDIDPNIYQTVYQNYFQGNISRDFYHDLQKSWDWIPDSLNLSKNPIKSKIAFACLIDDSAKTFKMVVDANNNLDLSDDSIFLLQNHQFFSNDSLVIENIIHVMYERVENGKVIQKTVPLIVKYQDNMLLYSYPTYSMATLNKRRIAVCNGHFSNPSDSKTNIVLLEDSLRDNDTKVYYQKIISMNEYINVDGEIFKNKGVDLNKNVLMLEKIDTPQDQLYSTQIGYKLQNFKCQSFVTQEDISLTDFRGKYLFLDFWAVWCGPCQAEIPILKTIYDSLDTSKVEFLGIVCESDINSLQILMDQYSITWNQIISDSTNSIREQYEINGYPTSFLIDPNGVIIAKNLSGKSLSEKIQELLQ